MAEQIPGVGSSNRDTAPGESSDTNLELNVKTLDSRTFHFQVDKNMQVSSFKEKIANDIGVAVAQQRLIFRGKVLKDDHLLSQYQVETGDTLHLVERQPTQPQPSTASGSGETTSNGNRGYDANAGVPRGRVGQISHSVVLGTFNVGDQGESIAPDITRVIGTVLNSIGLYGNGQSPFSLNIPGQGPQGSGTEGVQGNVGGQGQAANQPSGQATPNMSFQSLPQIVQVPLAAAAIPPIPDSLNTLMEFMNLMEQALSRNVNQQNPSSTSSVELPTTTRGMPSPEALGIVLRQAERLLSGQAVTALSHIAGRLEQEGSSSDPSLRSQIQNEAARTGVEVQHLGALLLELGRTMLCLRMGQSPGESFVNAGPAVYISSFGPNPIMVQPFPLQTNSLFGVPRLPPPPVNRVTFDPVGAGNPPRHLNIHIHAGTSLAPVVSAADGRSSTGEGTHGERGDSNSSRDTGTVHTLRNVVLGTGPPRPSGLPGSTAPQPIPVSGTQSIPDTAGLVAEINSQLRRLVGNIQEGNQAPSSGRAATSGGNPSTGSASVQEQPNLSAITGGTGPTCSSTESLIESADKTLASRDATGSSAGAMPSLKVEGASSSSGSSDAHESTNSTPLGLGLGGLERKKRPKQPKPHPKGGDGGETGTIPERPTVQISGQQLLQSLLSRGSAAERTNTSTVGRMGSPSPAMSQATNTNTSAAAQDSNSQFDVAGMMSQVLQSPALNGLLSGVSEQTGAGSPDVLRNMLQQVTQNPVMMNTVSRIAQQVDTQDLGSMFAGMGGGQGRGGGSIDLSRMFQQMMPIMSQVLGGTESFPPAADHEIGGQPTERWHDAEDRDSDRIDRVELESVARQIDSQTPIKDVFRSMVENAVEASGNGSDSRDLLDGLCGDGELANDYAEILSRDLSRRLQDRAEDR